MLLDRRDNKSKENRKTRFQHKYPEINKIIYNSHKEMIKAQLDNCRLKAFVYHFEIFILIINLFFTSFNSKPISIVLSFFSN